uniref:Uncharacterized protein n=1 Tax=Ackermannviridae sp. TaxID=2831612 RepID=A0A8S5VW37_9CAUD|nr:MAG TPA: hypothetical protein [Ackermannviridae sp.]
MLGLLTAEAGKRGLQFVPLGVDFLHVGDAAAVIGVVLAGQVAIHRGAFGDGAGAGVKPFIGFIGGSHVVSSCGAVGRLLFVSMALLYPSTCTLSIRLRVICWIAQ